MSGPGSLGERLRGLAAHEPPADGWAQLSRRLDARRGRLAMAGGGFALAASLLLAVGLVGLRPDAVPTAPGETRPAPAAAQEVAQLINRSQALERELSRARPQVAVWSTGRDARAAAIEQRLRLVDAQLNLAAGSDSAEQLWRDRVRLMNALVELHEPQAPALQYASYQY